MSLFRTFIALELPASLQDGIQRESAALREAAGPSSIRWVAPRNLHLTLKFLGDVSSSGIQFLKHMLVAEAAKYPCFSFVLGGLGAFPTPRRPRIVWIGIQAPPELEALQRALEAGAVRLGYGSEERSFTPHLTIGRVRQTASAADLQRLRLALDSTQIGSIGMAEADAISLMKSDLQPGGSVYTRLYLAPLSRT